jgi:hypothetical protein
MVRHHLIFCDLHPALVYGQLPRMLSDPENHAMSKSPETCRLDEFAHTHACAMD